MTTIKDKINFVFGSVSKTSIQPKMHDINFVQNRLWAQNGITTAIAPYDLGYTFSANGVLLQRCFNADTEITDIDSSFVYLNDGIIKAQLNIHDVIDQPSASFKSLSDINKTGSTLEVLKSLRSFVSTNQEHGSGVWATGIRIKGSVATATNSIVMLDCDIPIEVPDEIVIPLQAIDELLRIGVEPTRLYLTKNGLVFVYSGLGALHTSLLDVAWPDMSQLKAPTDPVYVPLDEPFFGALKKLKKHMNELRTVYIDDGYIRTDVKTKQHVAIATDIPNCIFNFDMLLALENIIDGIELSNFPEVCHLRGPTAQGFIAGKTVQS